MPADKEVLAAASDGAIVVHRHGGPAMVRAAAKNDRWVLALVDPADSTPSLRHSARAPVRGVAQAERRRLAAKALRRTAAYDDLIAA